MVTGGVPKDAELTLWDAKDAPKGLISTDKGFNEGESCSTSGGVTIVHLLRFVVDGDDRAGAECRPLPVHDEEPGRSAARRRRGDAVSRFRRRAASRGQPGRDNIAVSRTAPARRGGRARDRRRRGARAVGVHALGQPRVRQRTARARAHRRDRRGRSSLPGHVGRAAHGALVPRARARRRELDRDRTAGCGKPGDARRRDRSPRWRRSMSAARDRAPGRLRPPRHRRMGSRSPAPAALLAGSWLVAPRRAASDPSVRMADRGR